MRMKKGSSISGYGAGKKVMICNVKRGETKRIIAYMEKLGIEVVTCEAEDKDIYHRIDVEQPDLFVLQSVTNYVYELRFMKYLNDEYPALNKMCLVFERMKWIKDFFRTAGADRVFNIFDVHPAITAVTIGETAEQPKGSVRPDIAHFMRIFGFREDTKGFEYLIDCVELVMQDEFRIHSVIKDVYGATAEKYGTTSTNVDRMIRHLANCAGDADVIRTLTRGRADTRIRNRDLILEIIRGMKEERHTPVIHKPAFLVEEEKELERRRNKKWKKCQKCPYAKIF